MDEILPLRHKVMWPDKPVDFCKLPEDQAGSHYGLFLDGKLISCVSAFVDVNGREAQFRKFATDQDYQKHGYGTLLLQALARELKKKSVSLLWCDARVTAVSFYERIGFTTKGEQFKKNEIQYIRMLKELKESSVDLSPLICFSK